MDVPHLVIGLGSLLAGAMEVKRGLSGSSSVFSGGNDHLPLPSTEQITGKPLKATIRGVGNIDSRVRYILSSIQKGRKSPEVRAFAVRAVSQKCGKGWCIPERDWWGEVQGLFKAIRSNVRYTRDIHKLDTFQSPQRTLQFRGGDCDDFSITLGSALQSIGYPIKVRIVQSQGSPDYNHIFLLVGLPPRRPNQWFALDASLAKPPGWHPPRAALKRIKDYDVP
jgi:hypothetical protein